MKYQKFAAAATALLVIGACATTSGAIGTVLPNVFTQSGNNGPLISNAGQTEYAADAEGVRFLDQVENQGELNQLVLDMPQAEAELNALLARVSQHWPHDMPVEPRIKLTMIAQYSGAAYADGTLTLGLGTFAPIMATIAGEEQTVAANVLGSDEELMYLIGHEFGHYALGHHNKTDFMSSMLSGSAKVTKLYNQAAILSQMRYVETTDGQGTVIIEDQSAVDESWNSSIGTLDLINAVSGIALGPSWNRTQEDEADVLSLDLLKAEGLGGGFYEPMFANLKAHETLTKQLQTSFEDTMSETQSQFLSSDNIAQVLGGQFEQSTTNILENARDGLFRQGTNLFVGYVGQTHRPPSVRLAGVQKYERQAYGMTAEEQEEALFFAETSTEVIDRIRASAEFQHARQATLAYYGSIAARKEGDLVTAESRISEGMNTPIFGQQAAILFEAGRVAEATGNPQLAMQRYTSATFRSPIPEAYRRLTYVQIRSGLYNDAARTIADGTQKLNDETYFYPSRIRLAVVRELHDDAIALLATCRDDDNDDLVAACEAARAGVDFDSLTPEQRAAYAKEGRVGQESTTGIFDSVGDLFGGGSDDD